jgi:hypothetical protein
MKIANDAESQRVAFSPDGARRFDHEQPAQDWTVRHDKSVVLWLDENS